MLCVAGIQGKKQYLEQPITSFRLSERVPKHNLYRRLDELLDLRFLCNATAALYHHTGQPSLDPVVFFQLLLAGRPENIVSDRRLVEPCALRLDIRYFLSYDLDEELIIGGTQALDSAPVKANAALKGLQEKRANATEGAAASQPRRLGRHACQSPGAEQQDSLQPHRSGRARLG
ncbi:transposase [Hymenobacter sp. B81]|uniref:transposase n=1 Tax=Hymenobacter sp. B81 TaxID=3344878 RepID=UPI0037DD6F8E